MTKKTADSKSDSKHKPATHLDPVPKKTTAASRSASPLHTGDDPDATPPHTTADTAPDPDAADPDAASEQHTEPVLDHIPAPVVPVPDPSPSPEPHQPSGADEIMRRHRLVDPGVAEAHAAEAEDVARQAEEELERRAEEDEKETKGNPS